MAAASRDPVFRIKHTRNLVPPDVPATSFTLVSVAPTCFPDPADSLHDPV
jgi:hypothetical protein